MQEVKNTAVKDQWDISMGDYESSNNYSKGQSQIRKRAKLVRTIILLFTGSISLLVFIFVLKLMLNFNALN